MVPKQYNPLEKTLIVRFREGDRDAFTIIFTTYYKDLVLFAMNFIRGKEPAEEIVQDTFVKLWDDHGIITVENSLKSYLLKCVQNRCIDWVRHNKIKQKYHEDVSSNPETFEYNTDNYLLNSELEDQLSIALSKLPAEIYEAYCMNRYKGLKYREIALKQNVSVRTVEVRISKALVTLREELKDYLS